MKRIETKVLFRPHALSAIMTKPQGKTNAEKYNEAVQALELLEQKKLDAEEKVREAKAEVQMLEHEKNDEIPKRKGAKSPAEKYRIAVLDVAKKEEKEDEISKKIDETKKKIEELEKVKDIPTLSKTCRNLLKTMAIEIRYKRRKRLVNKYVKKGLLNEEDSTVLYSEFKGEFLEQNKTRFENEWFTGETDLEFLDKKGRVFRVQEIKTCYDIDTFEDKRDEEVCKDHYYQLQAYCDLRNAKEAGVAYCLTNTDFDMINEEIRKETFSMKADELEGFDVPLWRVLEIAKDHIFDIDSYIDFLSNSAVQHLTIEELEQLKKGNHPDEKAQQMFDSFVEVDLEDRVIEIDVKRNDEIIQEVKEAIEICRNYMAQKYNVHHVL